MYGNPITVNLCSKLSTNVTEKARLNFCLQQAVPAIYVFDKDLNDCIYTEVLWLHSAQVKRKTAHISENMHQKIQLLLTKSISLIVRTFQHLKRLTK